MFFFVLFVSLIHLSQCYLLNISTAIINTKTIIACDASIDIHAIFDPAQVIICPNVWIEKQKIQLIYLNISFDNHTNQLVIDSTPPLRSPPKILMKFSNNSLLSPINFTRTSTYYLSLSSELLCRFSSLKNETICFYYPITSNFIHIEYHYDQIQRGSLQLSDKTRHRFYIIFLSIIILTLIFTFIAVCMTCTNRPAFFHPTQLEVIIDTQIARQEAAKRPQDQLQEGAPGHLISADIKDTHVFTEDI